MGGSNLLLSSNFVHFVALLSLKQHGTAPLSLTLHSTPRTHLRRADLRRKTLTLPPCNFRDKWIRWKPAWRGHDGAIRKAILGCKSSRISQVAAVEDAPPVAHRGRDCAIEWCEIHDDGR